MTALYGLAYTEEALRFLETLPPKFQRQIKRRVESLLSNPNPPGSRIVRNVTDNGDPVRRVRQGDYRILYIVKRNPDQIIVLDIGHRKDVYR